MEIRDIKGNIRRAILPLYFKLHLNDYRRGAGTFILSSQSFINIHHMKLKKSAKRLFFYGAFCTLLIYTISALTGCSLKYKGPRITEGGVMFRIKAPDAGGVAIAGSFNQWDTDRDMLSGPDKTGIWSIFIPLSDGRYEYLYIIDGTQWLLDPAVPSAGDGFGGRNSVISIKR